MGDPVNFVDPSGALRLRDIGRAILLAYPVASHIVSASEVSQATGLTLGGCVRASGYVGVGGSVSACLVATPDGHVGVTGTAGAGVGFGASALVGGMVSNAQCLDDLGGWFNYAEGSAGKGVAGAGGSYGYGRNASGDRIWAATGGWAPTPSPVPLGGAVGRSYTGTYGVW